MGMALAPLIDGSVYRLAGEIIEHFSVGGGLISACIAEHRLLEDLFPGMARGIA